MKPLRDYQERYVQTLREQLRDTSVVTIPADVGKTSQPHPPDALGCRVLQHGVDLNGGDTTPPENIDTCTGLLSPSDPAPVSGILLPIPPMVDRKPYHPPVLRSLGRLATMTRASTPPHRRPPGH